MSDGVIVTVVFAIKPERAEEFVRSLEEMFPVTRLKPGFRDIRLVRSAADPHQFMLIEAWDEVQHFQDYAQFRVETGDSERLLAMTSAAPQVGVWAGSPLAEARA